MDIGQVRFHMFMDLDRRSGNDDSELCIDIDLNV